MTTHKKLGLAYFASIASSWAAIIAVAFGIYKGGIMSERVANVLSESVSIEDMKDFIAVNHAMNTNFTWSPAKFVAIFEDNRRRKGKIQ